MTQTSKVGIIGCGFVGSACAYTLMQRGLFSEMVLLDADRARAEGEAMDIAHGLLFAKPMNIYAGTYADLSDAETASALQLGLELAELSDAERRGANG